jgi:hypothetical protein
MRLPGALVACALASAAALGGCGGDDGGPAAQAGGARLGLEVRVADCEAWKGAGVRERYDVVDALRAFAGDRTGSPGGHGATLEDEDAYDLLERSCEPSYSRAFKLYKLYTRAAAFSGLRDSAR